MTGHSQMAIWGLMLIAIGLGTIFGPLEIGRSPIVVAAVLVTATMLLSWHNTIDDLSSRLVLPCAIIVSTSGMRLGISEGLSATLCIGAGIYLVFRGWPVRPALSVWHLNFLMLFAMFLIAFMFPYVYCYLLPQRCAP